MPTDEPSAHRERRAYEVPVPAEDVWLCDYLRRTSPALLSAMYRADYIAPKYSREIDPHA